MCLLLWVPLLFQRFCLFYKYTHREAQKSGLAAVVVDDDHACYNPFIFLSVWWLTTYLVALAIYAYIHHIRLSVYAHIILAISKCLDIFLLKLGKKVNMGRR